MHGIHNTAMCPSDSWSHRIEWDKFRFFSSFCFHDLLVYRNVKTNSNHTRYNSKVIIVCECSWDGYSVFVVASTKNAEMPLRASEKRIHKTDRKQDEYIIYWPRNNTNNNNETSDTFFKVIDCFWDTSSNVEMKPISWWCKMVINHNPHDIIALIWNERTHIHRQPLVVVVVIVVFVLVATMMDFRTQTSFHSMHVATNG